MIYEKINKQVDHLITKVTNIIFSLLLGVIPQTTVHTSIQDVIYVLPDRNCLVLDSNQPPCVY